MAPGGEIGRREWFRKLDLETGDWETGETEIETGERDVSLLGTCPNLVNI
jgi:hypothetical protein